MLGGADNGSLLAFSSMTKSTGQMKIDSRFIKKNTVSQEGVGILQTSHPIIVSFDLLLTIIVSWFIADELETKLDSVLDIMGDSGHGYSRNHLEMIN